MRQEAGAQSVLFASILHAHAHQAERRTRLLRMVPLIFALHILAVVALAPDRRQSARLPVRAGVDDAPVLKLLAAPPVLPATAARAAVPAQTVTRRVVARKAPLRLKPVPPPRAPDVEESPPPSEDTSEVDPSSPPGTSEAEGGAATGFALVDVEHVPVSEGVGGALSGLSSGATLPRPLTPEEREASLERYAEALIQERFEDVRYPHLAAAAGIQGEVLLRLSISSQGRLLELELLGRCPHPVLCDAAQKAVRDAEPLPPPPPELGNPCLLELPFRYRLR